MVLQIGRHECEPMWAELGEVARPLIDDLRPDPQQLETMVEAVLGCKQSGFLLENIDIIRACVQFYVQRKEYSKASCLLEVRNSLVIGSGTS